MNKLEQDHLRAVSEDDVEAALKDASFGDALAGIDAAVLLEFYQRVLDGKLGQDEDFVGIALLRVIEPDTAH